MTRELPSSFEPKRPLAVRGICPRICLMHWSFIKHCELVELLHKIDSIPRANFTISRLNLNELSFTCDATTKLVKNVSVSREVVLLTHSGKRQAKKLNILQSTPFQHSEVFKIIYCTEIDNIHSPKNVSPRFFICKF